MAQPRPPDVGGQAGQPRGVRRECEERHLGGQTGVRGQVGRRWGVEEGDSRVDGRGEKCSGEDLGDRGDLEEGVAIWRELTHWGVDGALAEDGALPTAQDADEQPAARIDAHRRLDAAIHNLWQVPHRWTTSLSRLGPACLESLLELRHIYAAHAHCQWLILPGLGGEWNMGARPA